MQLQYETPRLILKVLGTDYASDVLRFYEKDKELFERYEVDRPVNFYTDGFQRQLLQSEQRLCLQLKFVRFYVFLKEDSENIIGTVSLYEISKAYGRADVGYKFASAYHHKGYATEALEKLIDIAFCELGLHRLSAYVRKDNRASVRLLTGLGFQKEGLFHDYMKMRGQWIDHEQYCLLTQE